MTSTATAQTDLRRIKDKDLIERIHATESATVPVADMKRCLKLLRKDHGSTLPLIKRVLYTGSDTAQEMVAKTMRATFVQVHESYRHDDPDENWKWSCDSIWDRGLAYRLTQEWNCGNVMEANGTAADEADGVLGDVNKAAHGLLSSGYPHTLDVTSSTYWRGLCAFALSKVIHRNDRSLRQRAQIKASYDFYGQVIEFIEWAAQHPDISTVISTAKERKTISVLALGEIIRQGQGAPALSSGVV